MVVMVTARSELQPSWSCTVDERSMQFSTILCVIPMHSFCRPYVRNKDAIGLNTEGLKKRVG